MTTDTPPHNTNQLWNPNRNRSKRIQFIVKSIFAVFAFISVVTTIGIVLTLLFETIEFFQFPEVNLWRFFTDGRWTPKFPPPNQDFGVFVLISATILSAGIAIIVAVPLGLLSAICLSEYASPQLRRILKPALEILAGIPTVVYGYFALLTVTPFLRWLINPLLSPLGNVESLRAWSEIGPFNSLSAGVVLGIMITPMVASLSEDAIYSVPRSLRDGSYALGTTKRETIVSVVLPAALSGIVSSVILAVSRAIGETMIVTLAAGQNPTLGLNPFVPVMTMTAAIVQASFGDNPADSISSKALFAIGMTLLALTFLLNIFSFWFVRRFREKYD